MTEKDQHPNNIVENKMGKFNNLEQSAINYVQTAIENREKSSQDATQNLVNEVMNREIKDGK
nr:hypothetical protein [Neobacillus sp. Marseille-Q6967]